METRASAYMPLRVPGQPEKRISASVLQKKVMCINVDNAWWVWFELVVVVGGDIEPMPGIPSMVRFFGLWA